MNKCVHNTPIYIYMCMCIYTLLYLNILFKCIFTVDVVYRFISTDGSMVLKVDVYR